MAAKYMALVALLLASLVGLGAPVQAQPTGRAAGAAEASAKKFEIVEATIADIHKAIASRELTAKALVNDIQRSLAKGMYGILPPGVATSFTIAWPALGNFRVFQGGRLNYRLWVDQTKAPFAK